MCDTKSMYISEQGQLWRLNWMKLVVKLHNQFPLKHHLCSMYKDNVVQLYNHYPILQYQGLVWDWKQLIKYLPGYSSDKTSLPHVRSRNGNPMPCNYSLVQNVIKSPVAIFSWLHMLLIILYDHALNLRTQLASPFKIHTYHNMLIYWPQMLLELQLVSSL